MEENAGQTINGITYDASEFEVSVSIDADLNVNAVITKDSKAAEAISFNNTSESKVSVEKIWDDGDNASGNWAED